LVTKKKVVVAGFAQARHCEFDKLVSVHPDCAAGQTTSWCPAAEAGDG
jgi:hypothetical protein